MTLPKLAYLFSHLTSFPISVHSQRKNHQFQFLSIGLFSNPTGVNKENNNISIKMDIVISIAAKIAEYTVGPTIRQLGYLIHYNHNIKELEEIVENLGKFKDEVQHRVDEAKRNAEEIEVKVNDWLKNAVEIIGEYNQFLENGCGETIRKCFNQPGLKFVQRHRLSRRSKKLMKRVLQIKEEGKFERVSYRRDPQRYTSLIYGESNYVNFKSRNSTKENIMKALKDPDIHMVGVCGMGGVGKTELVKEVLKSVKEAELFYTVVMTTISQDPNVRKIQGEIGDMLGLSFEKESIQGRALQLLMRFEDEKNILVVLDDIWKFLDLKTVGIPCNKCKILLTSREKHMLLNEMDVKVTFELNALDNDESWNFFKKVNDVAIEENSDLEPIAYQVAKECGGLPIALVTVAKALRGKSLAIWEDALDQLKNSNVENIAGMNEKVYSSLQLSYNFLEHDETKNIFLFCSMYPEDYDIGVEDDLLRYVVGMRLLASHDTMTKTRNRIIKLINDLKSSSLLLESQKMGNYVKMHDVIRDFARSFVSKREGRSIIRNNNVIFTHGVDFDNLSRELELSELELLVLTSNDEDKDSEEPGLFTLTLNDKLKDLQIPQAFFNGMDKIKVLEFEGKGISMLPSSLCSLTNLQTLSLLGCFYLKNINFINDLKRLEILSVRRSYIKNLPLVISEFTQLKVLDLSDCWELVISPNIISSLTNLEELDLKDSFNKWEGEFFNNKKDKASLSELKCLPRLAALRTWIPDEKILSEQMFSKTSKLERFEIIIGKENLTCTKKSKALMLNLNSRIVFGNDLKKLVNSAEELELGGLIGENNVFSKFGEFHLHPQLKHLSVYDNSDIDYIISEANPHLFHALAALESLNLRGMWNLESMIRRDIIPKSFRFEKLRIIQVKCCHKMRNLFGLSLMKCLMNLQIIEVEDCRIMEGIVVMENETDKLELHQLKCLTLQKLPHCTRFCFDATDSHEFDIIEEGQISNGFKPLFSEEDEFANLEELELRKIDNLKMIWNDKLNVDSFTQLKDIHIEDCKNLNKVFSSSMIKAFKALERLIIRNCGSLKDIFEIIPTQEKYNDHMVKIPLRHLHLYKLSNLEHVWSELDPQKLSLTFPTLQDVIIEKCPKLKSVFPIFFTKWNLLQQLEKLRISDCGIEEIFGEDHGNELQHKGSLKVDNLKTLWDDELIVDPFSNLEWIQIVSCKCLRKIFPSNIMGTIRALKRLGIEHCESLEEIFEIDDENEITNDDIVLEAQLEMLELRDLPNLNHVWSNDPIGQLLLFQKLQVVEVSKCPKITSVFPASFSKYLPQQIQSLKIVFSGLEEIFEKQDVLEKESVFRKVLKVDGWSGINVKLPSPLTFQYVRTLEINRCHELTNLLPCSLAKGLVQLQTMNVEDCKNMTSIIGVGEEEEVEEISFGKLEKLVLYSLPRVKAFHLGKCTIQFPSLNMIEISECFEMKTFSFGMLISTPQQVVIEISKPQDSLYEYHSIPTEWLFVDNDINDTIRKYWEKDVTCPKIHSKREHGIIGSLSC